MTSFLPMLLGPGDFDPPPEDEKDHCHICQAECHIDAMECDLALDANLCAIAPRRWKKNAKLNLMKEINMKPSITPEKPKSNGQIRAWLRGAFTAVSIISLAVNVAIWRGNLAVHSAQEAQATEGDVTAAAEATKPIKLSRNGR